MEHFDMNIYEREARKSILMDEGWESRFLDRQECCKYLGFCLDHLKSQFFYLPYATPLGQGRGVVFSFVYRVLFFFV